MLRSSPVLAVAALLLAGCGPAPAPPPTAPAKQAEAPKPPNESTHLPQAGQVETHVVAGHLLDKPFMPGGTVGHYKQGKLEYDMFVRKLGNPTDAALLLFEWNKVLTGSKLVAAFGGYYGTDGGRPVFVFAKGPWIAGIAGLSEKAADLPARNLATLLD